VHQYILRTPILSEQKYPLVLGKLTHLFIQLYNDNVYDKSDFLKFKDNLNFLHNYSNLVYPKFNNDVYEICKVNTEESVNSMIEYIKGDMKVYYHAIKLFNVYQSLFFPKINKYTSKIISEMTFNNVVNISSDMNVCFYGSIDILFYRNLNNELDYIYISDIKTGKKLYEHYFFQLFFYYWNIVNYNDVNVTNDNSNRDLMIQLKNYLNSRNTKFVLFSLQENKSDAQTIESLKLQNKNYDLFIETLFNDLKNHIYHLHNIDKNELNLNDIYLKYKDSYKIRYSKDSRKSDVNYLCNNCDYCNVCEFKLMKG
jgi:hypothetical protein